MLKRGVGLAKWEIQHKNVTIGRILGQGAFGEVRKGILQRRSGRSVAVAVKTVGYTFSCREWVPLLNPLGSSDIYLISAEV